MGDSGVATARPCKPHFSMLLIFREIYVPEDQVQKKLWINIWVPAKKVVTLWPTQLEPLTSFDHSYESLSFFVSWFHRSFEVNVNIFIASTTVIYYYVGINEYFDLSLKITVLSYMTVVQCYGSICSFVVVVFLFVPTQQELA